MDVISPTDYEVAAQFAHFFTAAFLVSEVSRLGHPWLWIGAGVMLAFASIKEFGYDVNHENPLVRGSSPLDFGMYAAGTITAVLLHLGAR